MFLLFVFALASPAIQEWIRRMAYASASQQPAALCKLASA
jgi:hypothetical protein